MTVISKRHGVGTPVDRVTTDHAVIRRWAEQRDAAPAARERQDVLLGTLDLDLRDPSDDELDLVPWSCWFAAFDDQHLEFVYREGVSDFFQLRKRG